MPDIIEMAKSGKCSLRLWCFLVDIRAIWTSDTQESEAANFVIQLIAKRCPFITLALLSNRFLLKKALCFWTALVKLRTACNPRRAIIAALAQVKEICVDSYGSPGNAAKETKDRWTTPPAVDVESVMKLPLPPSAPKSHIPSCLATEGRAPPPTPCRKLRI